MQYLKLFSLIIGTCLTFSEQLYAADVSLSEQPIQWFPSLITRMNNANLLSSQLQFQVIVAEQLNHESIQRLRDALLFFDTEEAYGNRTPANKTTYTQCVQAQREGFNTQAEIMDNVENPSAGIWESGQRVLAASIGSKLKQSADASINGICTMFPEIPQPSLAETVFPTISSPVSLLKNPKTGAATCTLTSIYQLAKGKSRLTDTIKALSFTQATSMLFYNWTHAQLQIKRYQVMRNIALKYMQPRR